MGTEIPETIYIAVPAFLVVLLAGVILVRKKILPELERRYGVTDENDTSR